jgi:hypothetical protein
MAYITLYKSVLEKLSALPVSYLRQVDIYLTTLSETSKKSKKNRSDILALAGSWADMSEKDFQDYLQRTKETSLEMFSREIEL